MEKHCIYEVVYEIDGILYIRIYDSDEILWCRLSDIYDPFPKKEDLTREKNEDYNRKREDYDNSQNAEKNWEVPLTNFFREKNEDYNEKED